MMDRDERTTHVAKKKKEKSKKFFVNDQEGVRRKVDPTKPKFDGTVGDSSLTQPTTLNGHTYPIGLYPFPFWEWPIFDKHDNPIEVDDSPSSSETGNSSLSDSSPSYDPTPSFDSSPSQDSGSSYDSGSSSSSSSDSGSSSSGGFDSSSSSSSD